RRRPLTDVGDAEVGELVPRAVDRDEAHERDRYDPDHQQGGENFLPKPNTWPTHISPALRDGPHSSWRPYARVSLVRFHQADQSWNGRRSYRKGPSTKSGGAAPRPPRLGESARQHRVKHHNGRARYARGGQVATGTIKKLVGDRGFGFIQTEDGS